MKLIALAGATVALPLWAATILCAPGCSGSGDSGIAGQTAAEARQAEAGQGAAADLSMAGSEAPGPASGLPAGAGKASPAGQQAPDGRGAPAVSDAAPRALPARAAGSGPPRQIPAANATVEPSTAAGPPSGSAGSAGEPSSAQAGGTGRAPIGGQAGSEPPGPDPVGWPPAGTVEANVGARGPGPVVSAGSPAIGAPPSANPKTRSGKGKHGGEPFDPIKENGPVFVGWPQPKLAIVLTGRQHGYIEPCGCAGLDRMKGGMSRRHTMFEQFRQRGWPVVGADAGSIAKGFGRQAELKFHTMVEGMRKMGYDAINLGVTDLQLPAGELVAVAASVDGQQSPFLSANVGLFGFDAGLTAKTTIVERAGMKIGITGVVGTQGQKQLQQNDEIELADPEAALAGVVPGLKQKADYLILLCDATKEESIALARKYPVFDVVSTTGGAAEPPAKPETIEGTKTLLVEVGEKGMNAVVLALFDDAATPWRYQRVPLDSRFPASRDMHLLLTAYQDQIQALGLSGLAIRPVPHPKRGVNGRFVGSKKCESCHDPSYRVWKKSGHAKAWKTLVELDPPRQFDPECISCHVVGWHPTKYYPYESGFLSEAETPHLINTGCETCHGPGENHVKAEMGSDLEYQKKMQQAMVVTKEESRQRQCYTCHDLDNSPDFDFETYWPKVEHYEME